MPFDGLARFQSVAIPIILAFNLFIWSFCVGDGFDYFCTFEFWMLEFLLSFDFLG